MSKWIVVFFIIVFCAGCAFIKQGVKDYQTGKTTPITEGEQSPKGQAQQIIDLVKNVPIVGNYTGVLLPILVGFLTWKRGKKIRTEKIGENPIAGTLGVKVGIGNLNLENLIKLVTDTIHGAFEVGADGSAIKRVWKVWLSIILASASGALFIPGVKEFLLANGKSVVIISFFAGLFGGLEKKIQSLGETK